LNAVEAALAQMLGSPGLLGVALVDAVTGLEYGVAGDAGAVGDGEELARIAGLVADVLNRAGAAGELEDIVVTSASRLHITRVVPRQGGDELLLCAAVDRRDTNFALAVRELARRAEEVMA
jgi:hypothetical protein